MSDPRQQDLDRLTAAIALTPDDVRLLTTRAALHDQLGRSEAAKADYLAALAVDSTDFRALNDLGVLLQRTHFRTAARTAYAQAILHHPDNPIARINLGACLLEDGMVLEARAALDAALRLDPDHPDAHQALANALQQLGEHDAAERHRQASYARRAVVHAPYRGEGQPVRVLQLVSAAGGNLPTRLILDDRLFAVATLVAETFGPDATLPPHEVVLNAVADADLAPAALERATAVRAATPAPFLNRPERVARTGRLATADRLAALRDVVTPKTMSARRADAAAAADALGFPLLARSLGYHTGQHFVRVARPADLKAALAGLPGAEVLLMQPLDARDADGWFHKHRVMAIGGVLYPLHLAFSRDWKVHYFSAAMHEAPSHRAREEAFLTDMPAALGARAMGALERIAEALDLDYAGMDFALAPDGRVLLFEANAAMTIVPPGPDPMWDYRRAAIEAAIEAARALVLDAAARPAPRRGEG